MANKKCPPVGAPAWMATFADMATLLMAFFVLLLSFSTMDAARFKKMAESMKNAFGVQRDVPASEIPMGVSIIAQHFSPATTEPTPLEEVKQSVRQKTSKLELPTERTTRLEALQLQANELKDLIVLAKKEEIDTVTNQIKVMLKQEINANLVSVETRGLNIVIRINEKGSFSSGSAELKTGFSSVMNKIAASIRDLPGKIMIGGHTDDVPIKTDEYRSNWELSASRAVTVAHYLLLDEKINPVRVEVTGHADTLPIELNDTAEHRAKNRRVEIILSQEIS
ncbi:MAG: MotB family protein [Methylococcales bacterium]